MLKTLRFYYWLLNALVARHKVLAIASLVGIVVLASSVGSIANTSQVYWNKLSARFIRQSYTEAVVGHPKVINPLFSTTDLEKDINEMVFQALFKVNSKGEPVPELAESFQIVNDKEYVINLRKDVHWHDGRPFTARDVVYTIKLAQNKDYNSRYFDTFKDVKVTKITDYNLKLSLKEPFAPFLTTLDFGIIPEHIKLKEYRPIGTGFFMVKRINAKEIVLTKGWLDLVLKFYPDYESALTALKLGEVQGLGGVRSTDAKDLDSWPNFTLHASPTYRRYVALYFNLKSGEVGDKSLRQALRYATPKNEILEVGTAGNGVNAVGPLQPTSWAVVETKDTPFNLTTAKGMLTKAGWVFQDGAWVKDGTKLSVNLSYTQNLRDVAGVIAKNWKELGLDIVEKEYDPAHFKEQVIIPKNFDVVLTTREIPADPDQYTLWHSTQLTNENISGYSSEKTDKMLEDGRKILKIEDRKEKYLNFQKYINDDVPAIFLYFPSYNYVVSSRIKDFSFEDFNVPSDRFNSSLNWEIAKRYF